MLTNIANTDIADNLGLLRFSSPPNETRTPKIPGLRLQIIVHIVLMKFV